MQADESKQLKDGKFRVFLVKAKHYFNSRTFTSTGKGLLIVGCCVLLFSTGVFLGLRASFTGGSPSGVYKPDGPGAYGLDAFTASEQSPPGGANEPGSGQAYLEQETSANPPHSEIEGSSLVHAGEPLQDDSEANQNSGSEVNEPFTLGGIIMPASGQIIRRPGWFYSEELGDWRYYPGVEIATTPGTEVRAAGSGVIKRIYRDEDFGVVIALGHGDRYESRYGRVSCSGLVPGQQVSKGETIGWAAENILHFELLNDNEAVDPLDF